MKIVTVGIDLGKNLCSVAGLDASGAIVLRRRMKRESVLPFTAQLEQCTVAMEGMLRGSPSGTADRRTRPRCTADVGGIC
jgi:transposase